MNFVLGVIIILISILNITLPEVFLQFQDILRIRGKREYTSYAIKMTRFGGIIGILIGIFFMTTAIL